MARDFAEFDVGRSDSAVADRELDAESILESESREGASPGENVNVDAFTDRPAVATESAIHLYLPEVLLGVSAIGLWFVLFSGGIIIGTAPYREMLNQAVSVSAWCAAWLIVCAFWTITNIGLLACVASYIGALGRRTRFTSREDRMQTPFDVAGNSRKGLATYYLAAVMRGFGIYTLVLAGMLVFATETLVAPEQSTYMRLAPTVSIIGLYVGYDPSMFAEMLDRVKSFLQTGNGSV